LTSLSFIIFRTLVADITAPPIQVALEKHTAVTATAVMI
jgi:hypothetical protein